MHGGHYNLSHSKHRAIRRSAHKGPRKMRDSFKRRKQGRVHRVRKWNIKLKKFVLVTDHSTRG